MESRDLIFAVVFDLQVEHHLYFNYFLRGIVSCLCFFFAFIFLS